MKTLLELITIEMEEAFAKAGYDRELAKGDSLQPPGSVRVSVQRGDGGRKEDIRKRRL